MEELANVLKSRIAELLPIPIRPIGLLSGEINRDELLRWNDARSADASLSIYNILKRSNELSWLDNTGICSRGAWFRVNLFYFSQRLLSRSTEENNASSIVDDFLKVVSLNSADCTLVSPLLGIDISEKIPLEENQILFPIEDIPDSRFKKQILTYEPPRIGELRWLSFPKVAMLSTFRQEPLFSEHSPPTTSNSNEPEIDDICRYLSLVHPNPVSRMVSWEQFPNNPFLKNAESVLTYPMHEIPASPLFAGQPPLFQVDDVLSILRARSALSNTMREQLVLPLDRLHLSMRRLKNEDKALELGIALESLLLRDLDSNTSLTLQMRIRASHYMGDIFSKRLDIYKLVGDLYSLRSRAAHGSSFDSSNTEDTKRTLREGATLTAELAKKFIAARSFPKWAEVILRKEDEPRGGSPGACRAPAS